MMATLNIINTNDVAKSNGHYSHAIEANGFIFTSVQLGIGTDRTKNESIPDQLVNALTNIKKILNRAGSDLNKVVKLTIYVSDISYWAEINTVVADVFGTHKPARGIIPVKELHFSATIAVDVIAVK
jgi:reactive intermediate/imine deaminase